MVLHLLRGCELCRALLEPHLPAIFGSRSRFQEISPAPPVAYGEAIDRVALRASHKTLEESRQEALDLLVSGGLEALIALHPDVVGQPVVEALLERSWSLRFEDPAQMVQLAHAATIAACGLDERELGPRETEDLRCRAWTELANAYRVADELDRTEDALSCAIGHFLEGTKDEFLAARYFTVAGSFQTARRDFEMARSSFDIAGNLYDLYGDEHLAGRSWIMKAVASGYSGDTEEAIQQIEQGLSLIDKAREPGLLFSALQAQAWFLANCGRFSEALSKASMLKWLRLGPIGRLDELKLRWLEGQILAGLNDLDQAEHFLSAVKQGFDEAGLGYKAALVGLELAAVLLRQGRFKEGERTVRECAGTFLSLQIQRELHASVLLLQAAVEMRQLKLATLYETIDRLR